MNAVYSQIWVALILTILLWLNKALNGIVMSAYEMLIMMKAAFLTKNDLAGLCTSISAPKQNYEKLQPLLEGFKC